MRTGRSALHYSSTRYNSARGTFYSSEPCACPSPLQRTRSKSLVTPGNGMGCVGPGGPCGWAQILRGGRPVFVPLGRDAMPTYDGLGHPEDSMLACMASGPDGCGLCLACLRGSLTSEVSLLSPPIPTGYGQEQGRVITRSNVAAGVGARSALRATTRGLRGRSPSAAVMRMGGARKSHSHSSPLFVTSSACFPAPAPLRIAEATFSRRTNRPTVQLRGWFCALCLCTALELFVRRPWPRRRAAWSGPLRPPGANGQITLSTCGCILRGGLQRRGRWRAWCSRQDCWLGDP